MPFPRWLAQVNKRVFNPIEERRGARPVLIHTGRSSGRTYRTPLDAHRLPDGYLFIPMYGPRTDWVKNVLAAGEARLLIDGSEIELSSPRLVTKDDIWPHAAHHHQDPSEHQGSVQAAAHGHAASGRDPLKALAERGSGFAFSSDALRF